MKNNLQLKVTSYFAENPEVRLSYDVIDEKVTITCKENVTRVPVSALNEIIYFLQVVQKQTETQTE